MATIGSVQIAHLNEFSFSLFGLYTDLYICISGSRYAVTYGAGFWVIAV